MVSRFVVPIRLRTLDSTQPLHLGLGEENELLGGPWDAPATVDITQYLLDGDGVVVQGAHAIKITTTTLGRVEVYLD